ncbi:MAG: Single-stranded DNA-binding protein [Planctomycetes bacterium]|nr:Single-stranded DNA-binding protein [Planctomycetota bacterium]MCQ3948724.1 single-stranded DNA-binding protein [Planctomycetota bacterium]GIK52793.1 MAG: single-stranded DNA-binding protein [Planctomycetota bacterium]
MSSFNKVIVMGNLTRTPELRSTPGGTQVCDITVAVNENWTDQGGKAQERVTFVDVTVWGKTAETVCRWKKQGDAVLIEGRLQQDKWVDKESGKNRSKLKVVAENVRFVGSKGGGEGQGSGAGGQRGQASRGQPASRGQSSRGAPADEDFPPRGDDDYATSMPPGPEGEPPF